MSIRAGLVSPGLLLLGIGLYVTLRREPGTLRTLGVTAVVLRAAAINIAIIFFLREIVAAVYIVYDYTLESLRILNRENGWMAKEWEGELRWQHRK